MKRFRILYTTAGGLSLAAGGLAFLFSLLDHSHIRVFLGTLAPDGNADSLDSNFLSDMQGRLRIVGYGYLVVGAALLASRARMARLFSVESTRSETTPSSVRSRAVQQQLLSWGMIALLLVLAFLIRAPYLDATMTHDGAFSYVNYTRFGPVVIATKYLNPNNHILHTHLTYLSQLMSGGASEVALRIPAFVSGLLLIAFTSVLARNVIAGDAGIWAGWLSASFIASSSVWTHYSVVSRGYTLLALLVVLWLTVTLRLIQRQSKGNWLLFIATGVAAYYTIPSVLFLHAGLLIYLVTKLHWGGRARAVVASAMVGAGALILYLPTLLSASFAEMRESHDGATWGRMHARPLAEFYEQNLEVLRAGLEMLGNDLAPPVMALCLSGLCVLLVVALRRERYRGYVLLLVSLVLGALAVLLLLRNVPLLRTWYMFIPVVFVAAAVGLAEFLDRAFQKYAKPVAAVLTAAIASTPLLSTGPVNADDVSGGHPIKDAPQVVKVLEPQLQKGAVVSMYNSPYPIVQFYALRSGVDIGSGFQWLGRDTRIAGDFVLCEKIDDFCRSRVRSSDTKVVYESKFTIVYRLPGEVVSTMSGGS